MIIRRVTIGKATLLSVVSIKYYWHLNFTFRNQSSRCYKTTKIYLYCCHVHFSFIYHRIRPILFKTFKPDTAMYNKREQQHSQKAT